MKIKKEVDYYRCDGCSKEESFIDRCLACGREFCFKCAQVEMIKYNHGVHFQGSGDGYYCLACDEQLPTLSMHPSHKLHRAYLVIKNLRQEEELWYAHFDKRTKYAEGCLKALS